MSDDLSLRGYADQILCLLREILRQLIIGPVVRVPPQNASQLVILGAANTEFFFRYPLQAGDIFYVDSISALTTLKIWGTTVNATGPLSATEVSNLVIELHKPSIPGVFAYQVPQATMALSFVSATANARFTLWRDKDVPCA